MSTSGRVGRSPPSCPAVLSVAPLCQTCVLLHCPVPQRSLSNHKAFTAIHHQLTDSVGKIARQSLGQSCGHGMCGSTGWTPGLCPRLGNLNCTDIYNLIIFLSKRKPKLQVMYRIGLKMYQEHSKKMQMWLDCANYFIRQKHSIVWKRGNSLIKRRVHQINRFICSRDVYSFIPE